MAAVHKQASPRATTARGARPAPQWQQPANSRAPSRPAPRMAAGRCACGGGCPRCQIPAVAAAAATAPPLRLGAHDDAHEAAAERAASRITGLAGSHAAPRAASPARLPGADARAPLHSGAGQPLASAIPATQRSALQAGLHGDFSAVRLHHGASAQRSAAALGAQAYTLGPHIVWGAGAPALHSRAGMHLLAHELAHVGQADAARTVRRAPADYQISQLPVSAALDSSSIFFERGGDTIAPTEQAKIAALATPPGQNLTLHGFSSEDAGPVDRLARVTARLAAVSAALAAAGHTGARALVPHPDSGVGNIDYRSMRAVQVLPTPAGSVAAPTAVNPCEVAGSDVASGAELTACEASFNTAFPTALAIVNAAERDIVTTPTAAANAVVARFFAGVPRAAVNANVSAVAAQVRRLPTAHACHTACDGGCDRPAYNSEHGLAARPAGALMTLCPDYVGAGLQFRIQTLIHESAHATASGTIVDVAYSSTRLIPFLLAADALRNTDSYVLLMRLVHSAGSMAVGPAAADTLSGMTATGAGSDTEQAQRAVAWLESWLNYGGFDTSILYATLHESLRAGHWVTTDTNEFNIETMHRLATVFSGDLTDPGVDHAPRTSPPAPLPTNDDKLRVAALRDRYVDLYQAVNQRPVTVVRGAAGSTDTWGHAATRPYLQPVVTMSPGFFALSQVDQVLRLVAAMVRAHSDISASFEPKYVQAINLIHTHRGLGP